MAQVFDDWVYTQSTYTSDEHQALLGSVDALAIQALSNGVDGADLQLTVTFQSSSDGIKWTEQELPIDQEPVFEGQSNVAVGGIAPSDNTAMGYARLRLILTGGAGQARVKLLVCGRGREDGRKAAPDTGAANGAAPTAASSRGAAKGQRDTVERHAGILPDAGRPHRGTKMLQEPNGGRRGRD